MIDLAWEVKESAAHLASASDRISQTEDLVEASLRRHAENLSNAVRSDPLGNASRWLNEDQMGTFLPR